MTVPHMDEIDELGDIVEVAHVYEAMDDDVEDSDELIGSIEIHPDGRLAVLDANAARKGFLLDVIERMNSKPAICLISEDPGEAPFTTRSTSIERGEDGFIEAELEYLQRHYGLAVF